MSLHEQPWYTLTQPHSQLQVNEHLQVMGCDNIFCGGDVANIPEEKLAYAGTAEGVGIARNIWRLDAGKRLIKQGQEGFIDVS